MTTDISTLGTDEFSRMTTAVGPETIRFPSAEWSSADISASLDHSFSLDDEAFFGLEPQSSSSPVEKHSCACLSRALQQQEDVCINLQWAARGLISVPATEMLQCLKRGMEAYDELLDCRLHALQPERIWLLISTCDMMVSGAEHLVLKRVGGEDGNRAIRQHSASHHKEGSRFRATTDPGATSQNMTKNCKVQQSRHHFGQLILDEEEERCLFHSLLVGRAKRLSSLVERLHEVVDRDGRTVHIRLINNFRERCKTVLSTLKRQEKNDPW